MLACLLEIQFTVPQITSVSVHSLRRMSEYVLSVHVFCSALTDDQLVIIVDEILAQANARPCACTRNTSSVEAYLPLGPTSNLGTIAY